MQSKSTSSMLKLLHRRQEGAFLKVAGERALPREVKSSPVFQRCLRYLCYNAGSASPTVGDILAMAGIIQSSTTAQTVAMGLAQAFRLKRVSVYAFQDSTATPGNEVTFRWVNQADFAKPSSAVTAGTRAFAGKISAVPGEETWQGYWHNVNETLTVPVCVISGLNLGDMVDFEFEFIIAGVLSSGTTGDTNASGTRLQVTLGANIAQSFVYPIINSVIMPLGLPGRTVSAYSSV